MFEREADYNIATNNLPESILNQFIENLSHIKTKSVLSWSEHCTECAMPFCYQSCSFYQSRQDLKCRRFPGGFTQLSLNENTLTPDYLMKVVFGKWAKLEALGSTKLCRINQAKRKEIFDQIASFIINRIPIPFYLKLKLSRLLYTYKQKQSLFNNHRFQNFMLEAYNPDNNTVSIKLSIYDHTNPRTRSFDQLIELQPGYNKLLYSYKDISNIINVSKPFSIKLELMSKNSTPLYFGVLDFVTTEDPELRNRKTSQIIDTVTSDKKIKCVIWDLDNTLWNGTLIEDGIHKLSLNNEAVKVINEFERRGILNSIASKNNFDDAINALQHFGLENSFLHPQINWNPKSLSIKNIHTALNIGINTIAFIDDQEFEREEVAATYPSVEIFNEKQILELLINPMFNVPITEDSMNRKLMYQQEAERTKKYETNSNDYESFLKDCNISLEINSLKNETISRAYELAQRTNQMNFSGNRYTADELKVLNKQINLKIMLISASDKFGEYGIIGMVIFDTNNNTIEDLMFSCRIQAKMVDNALICHLINKYSFKDTPISIKYRESEKNKVAAKIFNELGFEVSNISGNTKIFTYPIKLTNPTNDIITIQDNV